MTHALVISLIAAGPGWAVVWSDGCRADTHDFLRHADAAKFFQDLVSKNPRAMRFIEGKMM
jgi:hypothetical protein